MADVIESLTEQQKQKYEEYIKRWDVHGLDCSPANRAEAEAGMIEAYAALKLSAPKIIWCQSPYEMCLQKHKLLKKLETLNKEETKEFHKKMEKLNGEQLVKFINDNVKKEDKSAPQFNWYDYGFGQHDASWFAFYEFYRDEFGYKKEYAELEGLCKVAKNSGWYSPYQAEPEKGESVNIVWMCERPEVFALDGQERLHNETGPAVRFRDGIEIFVFHGRTIPPEKSFIITNPEKITVEMIDKESNQEIKFIMIAKYGQANYIKDSGAQLISEDKFGKLYKKMDGRDILMMVEVLNSTPEPDGSIKTYYLSVDPTAYGGLEKLPPQAAVASTWRKADRSLAIANWKDYDPAFQS